MHDDQLTGGEQPDHAAGRETTGRPREHGRVEELEERVRRLETQLREMRQATLDTNEELEALVP